MPKFRIKSQIPILPILPNTCLAGRQESKIPNPKFSLGFGNWDLFGILGFGFWIFL